MGHSAVSLLREMGEARVVAIDTDPEMLRVGELLTAQEFRNKIEWVRGSGENTQLDASSVDAIVVGSAFHWMEPLPTAREFKRVLRPHGVIRIFEYQFPKAIELPSLNEWIRRQFNLHWKAPDQKPRGTLKALTAEFSYENGFQLLTEIKPKMLIELTPDELTGHILSQSRVLHFENRLSADAVIAFRLELTHEVRRQMQNFSHAKFDFKLSCLEFVKNQA